jgi:excisionase family DNA binding protein
MTFEELITARAVPDKPLYSPQEVSELLCISRVTLRAWCRRGRLDGLKAGKHWKFVTRESLKVFVEDMANA